MSLKNYAISIEMQKELNDLHIKYFKLHPNIIPLLIIYGHMIVTQNEHLHLQIK